MKDLLLPVALICLGIAGILNATKDIEQAEKLKLLETQVQELLDETKINKTQQTETICRVQDVE